MTAPNKMAKRAAAGTLALAVCLGGGVLGAGAAQAADGFAFDNRVAGADRIATAVEASKDAYPTSAGTVIIVNDEATVDGLTASYAAGMNDAPILYVKRDSIPAETAAEITRLGATKVVIVGGTSVVSNGVQTSLGGSNKTVTRLSGADRYATAAAVATSGGTATPGKVFIANGNAPADALAAGPIAFAKKYPVLLTEAADVPSATSAALSTLAVDNRVVLGGNTVVSTSTYDDLDGTTRLGGANRQATAVQVAGFATGVEGFAGVNLGLVGPEDRNTADALIASPLLAKQEAPLLFSARGSISTDTSDYLKANAAKLTGEGYVFGGEVAVPSAIATEGTAAAGGSTGSTGTIAVTPSAAVTVGLASETITTSNTQEKADADNKTYTATGLTAGETYRVTLVNSNSIKIDGSGNVTFLSSVDADSPSGFSANPGAQGADIVEINSTSLAAGTKSATAAPVAGTITFEIDGIDVGKVTPVIYLDGGAGQSAAQGGNSTRLETVAKAAGEYAAASEAFGLAGTVTFTAQASPNNGTAAGTVVAVDKENNSFTAGNFRYSYDSGDTFTVGGAAAGISAFEAALTPGDTFAADYNADGELDSDFTLTDQPSAGATFAPGNGNSANDITVKATVAATTDQVVVQRASVTGTTVGTYSTIATVDAIDADAVATGVNVEYVDNDRPAGTYRYRIAEVNDGNQVDFGAATGNVVVTATDTTAPTVIDTRIAANSGNGLLIDNTDSFTIVGSEVFGAVAAGDTIRVVDGDGTTVDLVNGTGVVFALNTTATSIGGTSYAIGRVLTVTATTVPAAAVTGSVAGLGIPATITAQTGTADAAGNALTLSGDLVIDSE